MTVYLCGPINGRSDDDCNAWRSKAKLLLGMECLDPMQRDFRGKEREGMQEIVEGDKKDIRSCDAVLVMFDRPSVGTSMEIMYAWQLGKPVLVVDESGLPPSPWLLYHTSEVFPSLENACLELTLLAAKE